jgi:hypothetical protein
MNQTARKLTNTALAMLLLAASQGQADTSSDAEKLLDWAEKTFPQYFSVHKSTLTSGPWIYRNYSEKGILAGVNKDDLKVYVMGGSFGTSPTVVGSLADLMGQVNGTTAGGSADAFKACDAATVPAGMTVSQSGNVVTVKTNGCIAIPTDTSFCDISDLTYKKEATGISIYSTTKFLSPPVLKGITYGDNYKSLIEDSLGKASDNSGYCIINAPREMEANLYTVNLDACYDMTSTFAAFKDIPSIPGAPTLITVTPPVTYSLKTSSTMKQVSDCFTQGAGVVTNYLTEEVWVKNASGAYEKIAK